VALTNTDTRRILIPLTQVTNTVQHLHNNLLDIYKRIIDWSVIPEVVFYVFE